MESQGGHSAQFKLDAQLHDGWRAVADFNQLTSLTFQLAFAPTFGEAVNSEVRNAAFLTNNFRGFSADFAATSYQNFVNAQPQVSADVRSAPEARFSSVDQAPWKNLPIYFGGDAFAGAVHRDDENLVTNPTTGVETVVDGIVTPAFVERSEIAPRVVVPLHWGPWLGVTTSFTARTTFYSSQLVEGSVVSDPLRRTTGEVNVDLRPATLERVWQTASGKWKHTIDPEIEYNYVAGVDQFDRFILFDEDETLTDTNDFVYSITQRLFHRTGDGQANDLVTWKIAASLLLRSDLRRRAHSRNAQRFSGARFDHAVRFRGRTAPFFSDRQRPASFRRAGNTMPRFDWITTPCAIGSPRRRRF